MCEKFAIFNDTTNQCECRDQYVRINNVCAAKDSVCDKTTQVWNDKLKKCECASGYSEKNGVCTGNTICPQGFTLFKGNCYRVTKGSDATTSSSSSSTPSTATSIPATSTTTTTSTPAQAASTPSQQPQQCQSPQIWNDTTKSCQCPANSNFDDVNRRCVTCK